MRKNFIQRIKRKIINSFFIKTYRYRIKTSNAYHLHYRILHFIIAFNRSFIFRRKILFFPDGPKDFHAIYKLLTFLGYRILINKNTKCNLSIKWWLAFDGNPFAPIDSTIPNTVLSGKNHFAINKNCSDISKNLVNTTFEKVFGYSLSVNPQKYTGKCVMKLNWNALHKGKIVDCPSKTDNSDFVYQKLVHNEVDGGLVEDMRVPVFGKIIPFVYLKYRSVENRLVDRKHTNSNAKIAEVNTVLSEIEQEKIFQFCNKMGLDYCELDVLRDKFDGRIYIVDSNNTPSGPPSPISETDEKIAVIRLAEAFEKAYAL